MYHHCPVSHCSFYCSLSTVVVEVEGPGTVYTDEVSKVTLSCKIYGYPRDPSPPVWTFSERTSDELQSGRFNTAVTDVRPLNGSSISTTERVVSQLTIRNVTEGDSGEYTCSVQGNSTTVTLDIITGKFTLVHCMSFSGALEWGSPCNGILSG